MRIISAAIVCLLFVSPVYAQDTASQKVSINTATQAQIETLPLIGPVKAKAIIAGRPYKAITDIMKVKGIKQKTFDSIKDKISL